MARANAQSLSWVLPVNIVKMEPFLSNAHPDVTGRPRVVDMAAVIMTARASVIRALPGCRARVVTLKSSGTNATSCVRIRTATGTEDVAATENASAMPDLQVPPANHVRQATTIIRVSALDFVRRMRHAMDLGAADQTVPALAFPLLIAAGLLPAFCLRFRPSLPMDRMALSEMQSCRSFAGMGPFPRSVFGHALLNNMTSVKTISTPVWLLLAVKLDLASVLAVSSNVP